jgi:hypothetical protein
MEIGKKVGKEALLEVFKASEGSINMYYGMIGNGKTYAATSDILDLLEQGKVVYANWRIVTEDHDDRDSLWFLFFNLLLFKKRFYRIPCAQNLYFFDVDQGCFNHKGDKIASFDSLADVVEFFSARTDCEIFWDEGQDMFDSYEGTKFSKAKRRLILHTRHYHRTLNIISQRPTAIQVSARGNVNRFYKCIKVASWPWPRFARYEFQAMTGETVDETVDPVSAKTYWGRSKVFNAYNTDYLAEGIEKSQNVFFEAWDLSFKEKVFAVRRIFSRALKRREKTAGGAPQVTALAKNLSTGNEQEPF